MGWSRGRWGRRYAGDRCRRGNAGKRGSTGRVTTTARRFGWWSATHCQAAHIMYEARSGTRTSQPAVEDQPRYARRMEKNIQLLEYKCQPFTEELLCSSVRKK